MNYQTTNMPSHGLGSDRYSLSNLNLIAATSLATVVFIWVVIHRRSSDATAASSRTSWRRSPAGIIKSSLYSLVSTVTDGPFRVLDFFNSTAHHRYSGLDTSPNSRYQGPPGLRNINNSCYQNSTIQGFASLTSLRRFLQETTTSLPNLSEDSTTTTLFRFLQFLADDINTGGRYWLPRVLKSMDSWEQQDAQEYFSRVLDDIEKDITAASKLESEKEVDLSESQAVKDLKNDNLESSCTVPVPRMPLEGLTAQYVQCATCGFSDGLSLIPFTCLTVPLERVGMSNIESCLDEFTHLEEIHDVQCAKCTVTQNLLKVKTQRSKMSESEGIHRKSLLAAFDQRIQNLQACVEQNDFSDETLLSVCKISKNTWVSSTKFRQAVVASPPESLVLHINRSVFDETTGALRKNSSFVEFPFELDISKWCLSNNARHLPLSSNMLNLPYAKEFIQEISAEAKAELTPKQGQNSSILTDPEAKEVLTARDNLNSDASARTESENGAIAILPESHEELHVYPWTYQLRSLVAHHGRHENGHYVCYRYQETSKIEPGVEDSVDTDIVPSSSASDAGSDSSNMTISAEAANPPKSQSPTSSNGSWWYISDDYVAQSSIDDVLGQGDVFMLFYERVPADPRSKSPLPLPDSIPGSIPDSIDDAVTVSIQPLLSTIESASTLTLTETTLINRRPYSRRLSVASTVAGSDNGTSALGSDGDVDCDVIPDRLPTPDSENDRQDTYPMIVSQGKGINMASASITTRSGPRPQLTTVA